MSATSHSLTGEAQGTQEQTSPSTSTTSFLFAFLVMLFCCWALSLPLFPTQDGPIHKYYVHAIASLISGSDSYQVYSIRHPFPPYAIHYAILIGLTKAFSLDLSEKIFICLIFALTAYSFRYCARSLGPSGDLLSLCMVPLVLHWSVLMGFLNYSLAVGLFFLAAGLWRRAGPGRSGVWLFFVLVVAVLTVTHPVPLLLLIAFCMLDLFISLMQAQANAGRGNSWVRNYRLHFFALAAACLCFLYPLASADRSRSVSNLHGMALHASTVVSSLILYGISPFDTRARSLLINSYRLGLYTILLAGIGLAAAGLRARWRARQLRPADTMLFGAVVLLLAIPFLPQAMNGSDYFAQRLMIFPWLAALAAASGYAKPQRLRYAAPVFALIMTAVTLLPAEIFMRPVSRELAALEAQPLPAHAEGLAILDPAMLRAVRVKYQLGFNPYVWSAVLPFVHADDVMLNSPWLDLTIMPLKVTPGGNLLVSEMNSPEESERLINGNVDLTRLPSAMRSPLLAATDFIVYVAVPENVQQGLKTLLGADEAARYTCSSHSRYLVCSRRELSFNF